jgi:hypothetical protein
MDAILIFIATLLKHNLQEAKIGTLDISLKTLTVLKWMHSIKIKLTKFNKFSFIYFNTKTRRI